MRLADSYIGDSYTNDYIDLAYGKTIVAR